MNSFGMLVFKAVKLDVSIAIKVRNHK